MSMLTGEYIHYRNSILGQTLTDTLDEMIHASQIQPPLANKILSYFDKALAEAFENVKAKCSLKGSLSTYRNCDEVWTLILRDVQFRFENETVQIDKVKVIACNAKRAE